MTTSHRKMRRKYINSELRAKRKEQQKTENEIFRRRLWAVRHYLEIGIDRVAEFLGVSERTIYRWIRRYRTLKENGLRVQSRRPKNIKTIASTMVEKILFLKKKTWEGCEKIALSLGISPSTVYKILKKANLVGKKARTKVWKHFQRNHSNSLWQLDFSMIYTDLWLLLVIDDHSRYIIGFKLMKSPNVEDVKSLLQQSFGKYGVPREILTDPGSQFYAVRGGSSAFDEFCLGNYIKHILASIQHPQTNGKVERKFGVIKEHLLRKNMLNVRHPDESILEVITEYVKYHNMSRWHFTYEYFTWGDLSARKKVAFIPYLRFVCHRN